TGQFVNGCSSTTLCVPQVGWNEQTNSLTVSGRAGSTGTLPGNGTGWAGGAISRGTPGGGCTSTGGGWGCTGTTTGGRLTRIRTGPPRMTTSARRSAASATTTRANTPLMLLLLRTSGWCGWVAVGARVLAGASSEVVVSTVSSFSEHEQP